MPGTPGGGCPGPSLLEIIERMPPGFHKRKMAIHKEGLPHIDLQTGALIGPLMGTTSLAKPAVTTIRKLSQCPEDKRGGCPHDPGAVQAGQALGSLNPGRLPACSRPRVSRGGSNLVTCSGVLLLLAEPQIEFEMRNPEPSCLCCEREACWQVFPTPPLWTR